MRDKSFNDFHSVYTFHIFSNYIPSLFNYSRIQRLDRGISDDLCVLVFVVSVHTISMYFFCVRCLCVLCLCEWSKSVLVDPYHLLLPFTLHMTFYSEFWTFSRFSTFFLPSLFLGEAPRVISSSLVELILICDIGLFN